MAVDFLTLLSPTWRKKAKRTADRKGMIVACLTGEYELPEGGADAVVETLQRNGYEKGVNRSTVYEDMGAFRKAYRYFHGDTKVMHEVEDNREKAKDSALLGIFSLLGDHPELQTWGDVEESLRALPAPLPVPSTSAPAPTSFVPEVDESKTFDNMYPPPQEIGGKIREIADYLHQVGRGMEMILAENRSLRKERDSLRIRVAEYERAQKSVQAEVTVVETTVSDLARLVSIEGCGLPVQTTISGEKGGWTGIFRIVYSNDFRQRFFGDYMVEHERGQVVKSLNNLASRGRFYPGLNTKKFRRLLSGVPPDTRGGYQYSRAADDIRFTWKQGDGGIISVFNVHKHDEVE